MQNIRRTAKTAPGPLGPTAYGPLQGYMGDYNTSPRPGQSKRSLLQKIYTVLAALCPAPAVSIPGAGRASAAKQKGCVFAPENKEKGSPKKGAAIRPLQTGFGKSFESGC